MAKEILIANSNKEDQRELQRIFESTDYRIIFSESAEEALLRIKLFRPDLIIAASGLSEKSGLELCEDIRANSESKHIPFILLSNIFGEVSEKDCRRVQADGILSKPLHDMEVLDLVRHLTGKGPTGEADRGTSEKKTGRMPFANGKADDPDDGEELLLDQPEAEEIIELVDVVEEPETKMGIDDYVHTESQEPPGADFSPYESWDSIEEMVKPEERVSLRKFKPPVTGFKLSPEEEDEVETEEMLLQLEKEISPKETPGKEVEFFEKIELEEILEKVEQLKPSIEKEWPREREWTRERELTPVSEKAKAVSEEMEELSGSREVEERYDGLKEFEAALKMGIKQGPLGEEIQPPTDEGLKIEIPEAAVGTKPEPLEIEEILPLAIEEPEIQFPGEAAAQRKPDVIEEEIRPLPDEEMEVEFRDEAAAQQKPILMKEEIQPVVEEIEYEIPTESAGAGEEMIVEEMELEELSEEEFPEEFLEVLKEGEIAVQREREELRGEEETIEFEEIGLEELEVEKSLGEARPAAIAQIEAVVEEKWPEDLISLEARPEEVGVETLLGETKPMAISEEETVPEEKWSEELVSLEAKPEEAGAEAPSEETRPMAIAEEEAVPEEEWLAEFISLGAKPEEVGIEAPSQEIKPMAIAPEEIVVEEKRLKEAIPMGARPEEVRIEKFEKVEAPRIFEEEITLPPRRIDRQVEEIIAKGVSEMMQEFLTKLLPEMTQNIVGLTLERIEEMVKEIVPDLAEKAIQEEIKRLQKGEKD